MYNKGETTALKTEFWNKFSVEMRKYSQKYGTINWSNYKTKIKDLYFRLEFTETEARFSIELQHPESIRGLFYEQFTELKVLLEQTLETQCIWEEKYINEYNHAICRIYVSMRGVNLYNRNDWQKVHAFFEKKMIQIHCFWLEYRDIFKTLES